MIQLISLFASLLSTRGRIMKALLGACALLLLGMVFLSGRSSKEDAQTEKLARHHFETLKDVNDAIDDLGSPSGNDLRCLLKQRGEIRDTNDLLCP